MAGQEEEEKEPNPEGSGTTDPTSGTTALGATIDTRAGTTALGDEVIAHRVGPW